MGFRSVCFIRGVTCKRCDIWPNLRTQLINWKLQFHCCLFPRSSLPSLTFLVHFLLPFQIFLLHGCNFFLCMVSSSSRPPPSPPLTRRPPPWRRSRPQPCLRAAAPPRLLAERPSPSGPSG